MNNSDLARDIALDLATRVSVKAKGWSWVPGVVLFPEVRCPYCKDVVKSRAVWKVQGNYLLGQAVPVAGQPLVLDRPRHPHATPSTICMGNATDPLQALFNGLNPDSAWCDIADWLQGPYWEHSCEEMVSDEDEDEEDDRNSCESCGSRLDDGDEYSFDDTIYCESCFNDRAFYCDECDEKYARDDQNLGADEYAYCDTCWNDKFFQCDECEKTCYRKNLVIDEDDQRVCNDCTSTCQECTDPYISTESNYCINHILTVCNDCFENHGEQCKNQG